MAKTAEEKAADKAKKDAEKAAKAAEAATAPSADNTAPAVAPTAEAAPAPEPEAAAKGDIVVKYRDHKGEPTERIFSKDVHGKDFAKLAAEFKETNASRIIA
jgi:hypothetical protein